MSGYDDDSPFDEDELREAFGDEAFEGQSGNMTPEEVFTLVMVNKKRKVKTKVELRDENGEQISLAEVIEGLLGYMKSKLGAEEENQFADQIYPLMSQALVSGMGRFLGVNSTAFYLSNDILRMSMVQMMSLSFLLLKYVQDKKLKIYAIEEPVTDEEIEAIHRKSKANSLAMLGAVTGHSPREILKELLDKGELTEQDVKDLLKGKSLDDDDEPKEQ